MKARAAPAFANLLDGVNGLPMKGFTYRVVPLLILPLMGLSLFACVSMPAPESSGFATPQSNTHAQSTLDRGRNELDELAHEGTAVSIEMAKAAATQQAIQEETRLASNAEAFAINQAATDQSLAAAATESAYYLIVTQTAQAQAILDAQAAQTAQANATGTAFSLTATPLAALQADLARRQEETDRVARWETYFVAPMKVALWFVAGFLVIGGAFLAYRWLMLSPIPVLQPIKQRALKLIQPVRPRKAGTLRVEIVGPSDPSVVNWIAEAEKELRNRQ
ncbi:MAG TPA: hypothetical protein VMN57_14020 [Anaerolineales bacterium]|nr:hypothetical protein [Anaerolineales bacterium]